MKKIKNINYERLQAMSIIIILKILKIKNLLQNIIFFSKVKLLFSQLSGNKLYLRQYLKPNIWQ